MFFKILTIFALIISLFIFANAQNKSVKLALINSLAIELVKPEYSKIAEDLCVGGRVNVETLLNEKGDVIEAKAISGDKLLYEVSVEAVKKSKFRMGNITGKTKGIIVYNFDSYVKKKCVDGGVLNNKALNIPIPSIPSNHLKIKKETEIKVRVLVDLFSGKIVAAHTLTRYPIGGAFEAAAKNTTFTPFQHGSQGVFVKGILIYKIKINREVEFPKTSKKIPIISCGGCGTNPISLPKPVYPRFCRCSGNVQVKILINEKGNVETAEAISGHPILRAVSQKAALKAKFKPASLSGKPVKIRTYIVYRFDLE